MRLRFLYIIIVLFGISSFAQDDENPVLWSKELKKISETEFELIMTGKIYEGWHVYSQNTAEGGSMPSEFTFDKAGEDYELVGVTEESKTITLRKRILAFHWMAVPLSKLKKRSMRVA